MLIAITNRLGVKDKNKVYYLHKTYQDIFDKLNINLIPVNTLTNIEYIESICDGLIITGGLDINPKLYNEKKHNKTNKTNIDDYADELDFKLIEIFSKKNKPILGICRGIQSINVYFGGTLYQDIKNHSNNVHNIKMIKDTLLYDCYKKELLTVNSYHHQAIKTVAPNFKVSALSEDKVIEAIEKDNIIGVEWHPEKLNDLKIFKKFIDLCKNKL